MAQYTQKTQDMLQIMLSTFCLQPIQSLPDIPGTYKLGNWTFQLSFVPGLPLAIISRSTFFSVFLNATSHVYFLSIGNK